MSHRLFALAALSLMAAAPAHAWVYGVGPQEPAAHADNAWVVYDHTADYVAVTPVSVRSYAPPYGYNSYGAGHMGYIPTTAMYGPYGTQPLSYVPVTTTTYAATVHRQANGHQSAAPSDPVLRERLNSAVEFTHAGDSNQWNYAGVTWRFVAESAPYYSNVHNRPCREGTIFSHQPGQPIATPMAGTFCKIGQNGDWVITSYH
jgi:hypothetical protein